jgi:hypothetical protein
MVSNIKLSVKDVRRVTPRRGFVIPFGDKSF